MSAGVTQIQAGALGAGGGSGAGHGPDLSNLVSPLSGGQGGSASATLTVVPGDTLATVVGGVCVISGESGIDGMKRLADPRW